jgi:signal transduction histidine kinase
MPVSPVPRPAPDFQAIFDAAAGSYLILTTDLIIVAVSDAYLRATETTREGIIGRGIFEVFPDNPDDLATAGSGNPRASLERVLATGAPDTMLVRIHKPKAVGDGFEEHYWSLVNTPVIGSVGTVSYIIQRLEDVTEFVRLGEKVLDQLKARLPEASPEGRIDPLLPAITMPPHIALSASAIPQPSHSVEESDLYGDKRQDPAGNRRNPEDLAREVAARRVEDREAADQLRLLNATLEQRVAARTAELQAANGELESFSYSVSHDLRAPLRSITGFSQIVLEDYAASLDEIGQEYLRQIIAAGSEMGRLIDDLLRLSRVTSADLHHGPTDLSALAHIVVESLAKDTPERTVTVEIADGLVVQGDERLLHVALENLLGNAWKYTRRTAAAHIEFGTALHEGRQAFFVRDNGAGFDMAYAGRLFGPFQRLHRAAEFEGSGIGLATVQRIIQRHGGRVWAKAAVNQGATFYFTLGNQESALDGTQR